MNIDTYIDQALRSEQPKPAILGDQGAIAHISEILIAAGDLADLLKRQLIYGKPISHGEILGAIGLVKDFCATAEAHRYAPEIQFSETAWHPRLLHAVLGSFGESAELLDALLISAEGVEPLDIVNVAEEVGDSAWYLALAMAALDECGVSPERVLEANIAKLRRRYPEKFSLEASEHRNVEAERALLDACVAGEDSDGGAHD